MLKPPTSPAPSGKLPSHGGPVFTAPEGVGSPRYTLKLVFEKTGRFTTKITRGLSWETAMDWRESLIAHNPALYSASMTPERKPS
jgi:hypothetical protein